MTSSPPSTDNILRGPRVRLTALTRDDLATIAAWYQDAGFLRLLDAVPAMPKTETGLRSWLETGHKADQNFLFAIRLLENDDLLGYVELDGILWNQQICHVSIGIGNRSHWGQGYGHEAMSLALRFAFDELNLHRVGITVFSYNTRAIQLYEQLGFQREGVLREYLHRDGKRYDMLWYGLLRREWQQGQLPELPAAAG